MKFHDIEGVIKLYVPWCLAWPAGIFWGVLLFIHGDAGAGCPNDMQVPVRSLPAAVRKPWQLYSTPRSLSAVSDQGQGRFKCQAVDLKVLVLEFCWRNDGIAHPKM